MSWFELQSGERLWYHDQGTGPALLMIHGWCMSSAVWAFQEQLTTLGFRLVTVDLPGHGLSDPAKDGFSRAGCVRTLVDLLDSLGIRQVLVIGWSLGTFIALELYREASFRVSGLVLVSATPRFVRTEAFPHGLTQAEADGMALKVRRDVQRAVTGFQSLLPAPEEVGDGRIGQILSSVPIPGGETALQALQELVTADERAFLHSITCPVLIVHGTKDRICLPLAAEYLSTHIPAARLIMFDGCGHLPFITQHEHFNAELHLFAGRFGGHTD